MHVEFNTSNDEAKSQGTNESNKPLDMGQHSAEFYVHMLKRLQKRLKPIAMNKHFETTLTVTQYQSKKV